MSDKPKMVIQMPVLTAPSRPVIFADVKVVTSEHVPKDKIFTISQQWGELAKSFLEPILPPEEPTHIFMHKKLHADMVNEFALPKELLKGEHPTHYIPLQKAQPVQDSDGVLTSFGMQIAEKYATAWVKNNMREVELERLYPELEGFFYDIRVDPELAREHAEA